MSERREEVDVSTKRLDALADYFDRTNVGDLPWEEATDAEIRRSDLVQVSVRLPKHDLDLLRARAARYGVGYTTLVRMLVRRYVLDPRPR